jgi:hypothetical protein
MKKSETQIAKNAHLENSAKKKAEQNVSIADQVVTFKR